MSIKELTQFRLQDLSLYRSELMGWSIVWIMMLHFTFTQISPLGFIAQYGFAGVEIFMFVSGLGLWFSLDKDSRLLPFYRKRLFRIFPTYFAIGIFTSLFVFHDGPATYLLRYTTIGFWINGPYFEWYIPSIIFLYLLAPLFKQFVTARRLPLVLLFCLAILVISYCLVEKGHLIDNDHYFLLYRIPAFLFGMVCAYWLKHGISPATFLVITLLAVPFFIWLYPQHHAVYRYKYLSVFFLMPAFILCFCTISKLAPFTRPLIGRMGAASLEIYLIQQTFFFAIINGRLSVPEIWHDTLTISLIIGSTLLGLAAHRLFQRIGI